MFGGLVYFLGSSSLPRYHVHRFFVFIHIHFLYEINHMGPYISLLWRAAKMVFHVSLRYDACEPQIRVRASGTLYVAEEEETSVTRNVQ